MTELNHRQAAKVRTAAQVAQAARALFIENGYDATTMRDIAKACGKSTGAIFANYTDKQELFVATMGRKPVAEAQGHQAMILLRALVSAPITDGDYVDQLAAIDRLRVYAVEVIDAAGVPELPAEQILEPDDHTLVEVMEAAIGVQP